MQLILKQISNFCLVLIILLTGCSSLTRNSSLVNEAISAVPKFPEKGSKEALLDEEKYRYGLSLRKTDRIKEAHYHSTIKKVRGYEAFFSQPNLVGRRISAGLTPKTHALLEQVYDIARKATRDAKEQFRRLRPYVVYPEDMTCFPEKRKTDPSFSYPSGHAAAAWSIGLTLSKIMPEKADVILKETKHIGDSRWICGYHWASDVDAAERMVTKILDRLMQDRDFRNRIASAQEELHSAPRQRVIWRTKP